MAARQNARHDWRYRLHHVMGIAALHPSGLKMDGDFHWVTPSSTAAPMLPEIARTALSGDRVALCRHDLLGSLRQKT